jgi:hypothetical protein
LASRKKRIAKLLNGRHIRKADGSLGSPSKKVEMEILENVVALQRPFRLNRGLAQSESRNGRLTKTQQIIDFIGAPYESRTRLFRLKIDINVRPANVLATRMAEIEA